MRKVLVSGATGFLGTYVIPELLRRGVHVVATSSSLEKACKSDWFAKVDYRPLDLSLLDDEVDYFQYFGRPDLMIHLAWEGLPNYKSPRHVEEYLPRHLLFLMNLIRNGLSDLTVAGTCLEYGMQEGCLSEDMAADPVVPYAIAKDVLREKVETYCKANNVGFKWARLFYMYGSGQNKASLFSQLEKAVQDQLPAFNMSGGEQERDFLAVEDMAKKIVMIALQNKVSGVINCCSGIPIKIRNWVEAYLHTKHSTMKLNLGYYPYPDYEPMRFYGNIKKFNQIL